MDLYQFTNVLPLNIVGIQANFFLEIYNPVLNSIMKMTSVADTTRKNTTRTPDMTTGTTIICIPKQPGEARGSPIFRSA
jgi:hypothetical protein